MKLALYSPDDLAWDAQIAKDKNSATEFSIKYNVRTKDEVDSVMETAKKAGTVITKPAQ